MSDPAIAEQYVLPGLREAERAGAELVVLDNSANRRYTSIAAAYNDGAERSHGRFLVFVHQDVRFAGPETYAALERFVSTTRFGVAGPSGIVGTRLYYSDTEVLRTDPGLAVTEPIRADLLDEALFVVERNVWEREPFRPAVTRGFHLCAAEYSLRMVTSGEAVYLVPLAFAHFNLGPAARNESETAVRKRRHVLNWVTSALDLQRRYPGRRIVTPQGVIGPRLLFGYALFYGICGAVAPRLSLRVIDGFTNSGTYHGLNRFLKGLQYHR
ncbi:MAG: glycosyltransferase family protein [Thermoplasmata archaeon]|nr:glycosyltransferase family protein [Thermoplasmata archaeon]